MFVPFGLVARDDSSPEPQGCKGFNFESSVCIGDFIAITVCSLAGLGFFFWSIHAIRKMREFPFTYNEDEDKDENVPVSAFDNSPLVENGVVRTPSLPERVRTRMILTHPAEDHMTPAEADVYYAQTSTRLLSTPPRASERTLSHSLSFHASSSRGGYDMSPSGASQRTISGGGRGGEVHEDGFDDESMTPRMPPRASIRDRSGMYP